MSTYTFIGDFDSKADQKNRLVMPSAFKHELEGGEEGVRLVVKKDIYEKCLLVYPRSVWEKVMTDLQGRIDPYSRAHTRFLREYQRNTCEVGLDANGRFLVPQRLLELIGEGKDFVLLGVGEHIELWDKKTYESDAMSQEQLEELTESIFSKEKDNG